MIDSSYIGRYSLFDGLDKEQIDHILSLMVQESFASGQDIVVEGKHDNKLRFILEGRVVVIKSRIILMELGEGEFFGEVEILDGGPVEATVKTLASTKCMSLSIDALGDIYEKDLKVYSFLLMNLARDLSRRLRRMDLKAANKSPHMEWN